MYKTKNHNDMFSVNFKKIKIQSFLKLRRDIIQSYPDIISYVRNGRKRRVDPHPNPFLRISCRGKFFWAIWK